MFALALGHDGLWVFADRILTNWIFSNWILAHRRHHRRGWLLARQVGGSGNAQHGEERSSDHYDDLHYANPPMFGHPDEQPRRPYSPVP